MWRYLTLTLGRMDDGVQVRTTACLVTAAVYKVGCGKV